MKSTAEILNNKFDWYGDLPEEQKRNLEWFYDLDEDFVEDLAERTKFFDYIQEDPLELVSDYLVDSGQMSYDDYLEMADEQFCSEVTNQVSDWAVDLLADATAWWAANNIIDYLEDNDPYDIGVYEPNLANELLAALPE